MLRRLRRRLKPKLRKPRSQLLSRLKVMRLPRMRRNLISRGDAAEIAVVEVAVVVAQELQRLARTTKVSR